MTNFSKVLFFLAALSASLTSCSDESPWTGSDSEGGINLNFSSDARVMRQTRADDGVSPVVPDGSEFAVSLAKSDGSYSKNWSSVDAFNREKSFPIGDYTISASYGDVEREGFELPCFKGSSDAVHVSPGAVTDVNVVATLANAMVSVRYTDKFAENFPSYSAAVQTEGHDYIVMTQTESRPAYICPSEVVNLNLTLTNQAGEKTTIQPATFKAVARHHYVITVDVTGNTTTGDLALDVIFDDDVVAETVNVSLGDDLFSAPAPTVEAKGFQPDVTVETYETQALADKPEFHVFAYGGLRSATLSVVSANGYTPSFGRSVQLVNADAVTQSQLAQEGVVCSGFFRNVDKMGVVNVDAFLKSLPAGEYSVELQVVDAMTRTSEPTKLSVKVNQVVFTLSSVAPVELLADEVTVDVSTNCSAIKDNVTFKVPDANNKMVNATIKSISEVSPAAGKPTRSDASYSYRYVLVLEPQIRSEIEVVAYLNNNFESVKVPMTIPDFSVEPDAFARKVVLKINASSAAETKSIIDNVTFYNGTSQIPTANISHDANGYVTIVGLNPGVTYHSFIVKLGSVEKSVGEFTTESENDVPNGAFSNVTETINISPIGTGGEWTGTRLGSPVYTSRSAIVRSTPNGWANVNAITCYEGSNPMNTWFVVPSTFTENGQTQIRSVGYSHNGTLPTKEKTTARYYNSNAPAESEFTKRAGELFLGSYAFDGNETRIDGVAWTTRPSSLTFDYSYSPLNDEQAEAYVKILSSDGSVISEKVLYMDAATSMTPVSVKLPSYPFGVKASKIILGFKSTKSGVTPAIHIPSGTELNDGYYGWNTFTNANSTTQAANSYKAQAIGSVLTVDNVKLGYETGSTSPSSKPARKSAKK